MLVRGEEVYVCEMGIKLLSWIRRGEERVVLVWNRRNELLGSGV